MISSLSKLSNPTADAASRITERADANKDGQVTKAEFQAVFGDAVRRTTPESASRIHAPEAITAKAEAAAKAVTDALAKAGFVAGRIGR